MVTYHRAPLKSQRTNCSSVLTAIVLEFGGMGSGSVMTGYESLLLCTDAHVASAFHSLR